MPMPPEAELETFDYTDFGVGTRYLARKRVDDDWIPDVILGVVRGGLFVAAGSANALGITDVRHVNVEFYTDAGKTLPEPILVGQEPYLADLGARRVLAADDVSTRTRLAQHRQVDSIPMDPGSSIAS